MAKPRDVWCPTCNVQRGQPCKTVIGVPMDVPHRKRIAWAGVLTRRVDDYRKARERGPNR